MVKKGFLIAAGVLCLVVAVYLIVMLASGEKEYGPELPPIRMAMAERLVPHAVGDMRGKLPTEYFDVVLLQFQGHRNALDIRKMVHSEIVARKALGLKEFEEIAAAQHQPKGWIDQAKDFTADVVARAMGTEKVKPDDMVRDVVKNAGMDGYLGGHVNFVEGSDEEERLELTLIATDVAGKEVFRETYAEKIAKSLFDLEYFRFQMSEISIFWRILIWVAFTVVAPILTFFIPARAIKSESNGALFGALAGYTVIDILLALVLMGFGPMGVFSFVGLLLAAGLGGFYNYGIFTEIKDFV